MDAKTGPEGEIAPDRDEAARPAGWPAVIVAVAVLFLVLALPDRPHALTLRAFAVLPLALPVLAALLLLSPRLGRGAWAVRTGIVLLLAALALLKLADLAMFTALARPFNLAYDLPLVRAGWLLLAGTSGIVAACAYVVTALLAFLGLIGLVWWAAGTFVSAGVRDRRTSALVAMALAAFAGFAALAGLGSDRTARLARDHVVAALQAARDIASLKAEAAADPVANLSPEAFLPVLGDRDVIVAFVESYGRSSLDNPLYAATTRAALESVQADLEERGLAMRSGWLTSPTVGGQSWLAHATLLSGLWIDSQGRYDAMLRSGRRTLVSLAAAGRRTVAIVPAITMPWPEAAWFGYEKVYAARDLGYHGLPFNWVTMPDQYTWSAFGRLELDRADRPPLFAEVALISSHAPWTPVPSLVPWEEVGDGRIFNAQATSGDRPEIVWRDRDRVRDQFRKAIDYALRTLGAFAARHADRPPLMIVLGDHQPATFVSGSETVRDVPVHIIGDPQALAHLDGWNWTKGLVPDAAAPVWRMDRFRDRLIEAFSVPSPAPDSPHGPA